MAKLIHSMLTSLDGFTEDEHGRSGWAVPEDEEVHSRVNELALSFGTYLYGQRIMQERRENSKSWLVVVDQELTPAFFTSSPL